jgi:hypothetical protein
MFENPGTPIPPPPAVPKKTNPWIIAIVVIVVVCCGCLGVVGLLLGFGPDILHELGLSALLPLPAFII